MNTGETFRDNCPHCRTKAVGFTIEYSRTWRPGDSRSGRRVPVPEYTDVLAICGFCERTVLAEFQAGSLLWIVPSPPEPPSHLPKDDVERYFQQGVDNLSQNYDAAGAMFRKTLETALKKKFPDSKAKDLYHRIEEAAEQQKLTPDLAKWAHQIRIAGKEAVHEKKPFSKEDAQDLYDFTHLVLLYLFTLPEMLEQARARRKPEPKSK